MPEFRVGDRVIFARCRPNLVATDTKGLGNTGTVSSIEFSGGDLEVGIEWDTPAPGVFDGYHDPYVFDRYDPPPEDRADLEAWLTS